MEREVGMLDPSDVMAGRILCICEQYVDTCWYMLLAGCKHVFAFETHAFLFEEDVFLFVAFTRNARSVVFGTGAKVAFQRIGHIGHSL